MGGIGSGKKPKVYDESLVARVQALYAANYTQAEIAEVEGLTQKIVWNLMRRHGIASRVAAKRDQSGDKNVAWKGEEAGYKALHLRVYAARGKPEHCEKCGASDRRFHWANLTGNYTDVADYAPMCVPCHKRHDLDRIRNEPSVSLLGNRRP